MRNLILASIFIFWAILPVEGNLSEIQVEGLPEENIDYADFRLWIPNDTHPERLLVVSMGTNQCALHLSDDLGWQTLARSLNSGLLCCYFVSPNTLLWGNAAHGSGRALIEALDAFAKTTGNPQLANSKLFLVGNSQGGVFCYHFTAWKPDRVLGFATLKGGFHDVSMASKAAGVPGLFVIGQLDAPFRITNLNATFARGRSIGAPWCLAVEPNSHHEPGPSAPLVSAFFQALVSNPAPSDKMQNTSKSPPSTLDPMTSWFPSPSFEKKWELFQTTGLPATLPTLSFESRMPPKLAVGDFSALAFSPVQSKDRSTIISIQIMPSDPKLWDEAKILPRSYLAQVIPDETQSQPASFSFRFNSGDLPLGQFSGDLPVRFKLHGEPVLGGINVPLSVRIVGDVNVDPPSIYLGPVNSDEKITVQVKLTSKIGKAVQLLSCDMPDEVKVTMPYGPSNPLSLTFSFNFAKQDADKLDSGSGIILLHLKTDQKWNLRIPYIGTIIQQK